MQKSIIITGASSGIGKALAYEYAARGCNLGLIDIKGELLKKIKIDIEKNSSNKETVVEINELDVSDYEKLAIVLQKMAEDLGGIDVVIANAGIGGYRLIGEGSFEKDQRIIGTNLLGAMATIDAAVRVFKQTGGGHIVGISSISSVRGLPYMAASSASKAGLNIYLEATRCEVKKYNIVVTTIYPGTVDTPLHIDNKYEPFKISAENAAKLIVRKIDKKVRTATIPFFPWRLIGLAYKMIPDSVLLNTKEKMKE